MQDFQPEYNPYRSQRNVSGWQLSFLDTSFLLLSFFVLLVGLARFDFVGLQVTEGRVALDQDPIQPFTLLLSETLAPHIGAGLVQLDEANNRITLQFSSVLLFDSAETELLPGGMQLISNTVEALRLLDADRLLIEVEGHTDDIPIGVLYPSNWELSSARASSVVRYLIDRGIPAERLKASGFAETRPLLPNRTAQGVPISQNMAVNRRVAMIIYYQ